MKKYDLVVIGGGAGGLTVAAGAASLGARVALIEKEEHPGGDCLHFGCIPSKALIETANKIYDARKLSELGLQLEGEVNMLDVKKRVKDSIASIQVHDDADRFRKLGVDVFIGKGMFHTKNDIMISTGESIFGKRIVISTGSRPFVPPISGIKDVGYLTNETIFELEKLPKRLLVIGGGPIGVELAQAMSRLGSNVTVVERASHLLAKEDGEVVAEARRLLDKELSILTDASVEKVENSDNGKKVFVRQGTEDLEIEVDEILLSVGRIPNSDSLGLENVGISTDERGHILVNDCLETNLSSVYAIGDVNGKFPFTHVAGMEGKTVVQNAVFGLKRKVKYDDVPWITYTSPEVFHLGMTEKEAKDKYGDDVDILKVPLSEVDRFVADHATDGFVKIITDRKGAIIGAHAIGKSAGDWMQEVVFAKHYKKKIGDISHVIHPYPNHAAAAQRTADLYWRKKLFSGALPKLMKKYIEWFR
ncbi:FAD-dependent oxidoreductase [Bacillus timonensis]|nr:FAD-dependent oxidoreductase [Bacillus timonensis]